MKKIILISVLIASAYCSFAQDGNVKGKFNFGIGPAASLPIGSLKEEYKYGFGIDAMGMYGLGKNVQGFLQAGLHSFKSDGIYSNGDNILHIPILLGARYINNGVFAGVGAGYAKWNDNFENNTGLAFGPQLGYATDKIHFTLHYTGVIVSGGVLGYAGIKVFRVF